MRNSNNTQRWLIVTVLSAAYFFAYFHRVSPAVLAPYLRRDLGLEASSLAVLSSMYFYTYALLQIPVGVFTDWLGARTVVAASALVACIGATVFAVARSFGVACVGRALVGAGVAGAYVPALKTFSTWAGAREFGTMTGMLIAIGNVGALAATSPLAFGASRIGWRLTSLSIGLVSLAISVLARIVMRGGLECSATDAGGSRRAGTVAIASAAKEVASNRQVLLMGVALLGKYGPLMSFTGLWGALYLSAIYDLSLVSAGNILMVVAVGYAVGSPFFGFISDRVMKRRKPVLVFGMFLFALSWVPFVLGIKLSSLGLGLLAFVMGAAGGGTGTLAFSVAKESISPKRSATGLAIVNTMSFAAVPIFQIVTGWTIAHMERVHPEMLTGRYEGAFVICLAGSILGLAAAALSSETLPQERARTTSNRVAARGDAYAPR